MFNTTVFDGRLRCHIVDTLLLVSKQNKMSLFGIAKASHFRAVFRHLHHWCAFFSPFLFLFALVFFPPLSPLPCVLPRCSSPPPPPPPPLIGTCQRRCHRLLGFNYIVGLGGLRGGGVVLPRGHRHQPRRNGMQRAPLRHVFQRCWKLEQGESDPTISYHHHLHHRRRFLYIQLSSRSVYTTPATTTAAAAITAHPKYHLRI